MYNIRMSEGDLQNSGKRTIAGRDIADRLLDMAVRVLRVCQVLAEKPVGKHVAMQLARSATAVGAVYEEARGAESKADFAHKVSVSLKELRETRYWIRLTGRTEWVAADNLRDLEKELDELCAILTSSVLTIRGKRKKTVPVEKSRIQSEAKTDRGASL